MCVAVEFSLRARGISGRVKVAKQIISRLPLIMRAELKLFRTGSRVSISEGNPEPGLDLGVKSLCSAPWLGSIQNSRVVLVQAQQLPGVLHAPGCPELAVGENGHNPHATDGAQGMELPEESIPARQAVQSKLAGRAHQSGSLGAGFEEVK